MRWLPAAALAALAALAAERPADACSCVPGPWIVYPAEGASTVPRNALVVVQGYVDVPTISLRDVATGAEVVATSEITQPARSQRWTAIVRPAALEAETRYAVTAGATSREFLTGSAVDEEPPAFAGLSDFTPEVMLYDGMGCIGGTCVVTADGGYFTRVYLDFQEPPPDAPLLRLDILRADGMVAGTSHFTRLVHNWDGHRLETTECDPQPPPLLPDEPYCARLVAIDGAGNEAGAAAQVCATTRTCPFAIDDGCWPAEGCLAPPPPPDAGPQDGALPDAGAAAEDDSGACAIGSRGARPCAFLALLLLPLLLRKMSPSR